MKLVRTLGVLLAGTAMTTAAQAADLYTPDPVIEYASPAFSWDGFYAGVGVTGGMSVGGGTTYAAIDGIVGVNATFDMFLIGAEGYVELGRNNFGTNYGAVGGELRAGVLVTPEVLLYVSGGGEYYWNTSTGSPFLGGGVEFAVADDWSVDLEYKHIFNAGADSNQVTASVLYHF